MGKTLTIEEVEARQERSRRKCDLYEPIKATSTKCRHYAGEGVCLHEREFLCVVWVDGQNRQDIEQKNQQLRGVRRWLTEERPDATDLEVKESYLKFSREGTAPPTGERQVVSKEELDTPPAPSPQKVRQPRQARHKDDFDEGVPERRKARTQGGSRDVYDLRGFGVEEEDGERHLLKNPELLTEEAVEALAKRDIEVTVKTGRGVEVALVPKYTEQRRSELSYRDARTLTMIMQVFPGATIDEINRIKGGEEDEDQ